MADDKTLADRLSELRVRANEALCARQLGDQALSADETGGLIHELEVHQIELEMQNEELRRTQQELEAARDQFSDLYDFAPVGYFTVEGNGRILQANLTGAGLLGVDRHRLTGMPLFHFIAGEDQDVFYRHHRQVLAAPERRSCEIQMVNSEDTPFYAHLESAGISNNDGTVSKHRTVISDITQRKRAEQALVAGEARFRAILDACIEGIITIDEGGIVESVNPAGARLFGYAPQELIGQNVKVLMPESFRKAHDSYVANYLKTGRKKIIGSGREVLAQRKDGTTFPIELGVSEVTLGNRRLFTGIARDISERYKIEQMRKEFCSIASHELRTPLTNMSLSLDLIARGEDRELPPHIKTMIDIARRSSERLTRLVNDLLDIHKFEAGEMALHIKPLKLMPLVEEATEASRAYAEQCGVHYRLASALPDAWVKADGDRLMQVLTNLLSNAAKFSPANATVEVSVARREGALRVAVTDSGPGIPAGFREQLFHPFTQAKPSLEDARHKESAGLGLSIAKAIIEKLGGRIGLETEPHGATTFYFELPEWRDE